MPQLALAVIGAEIGAAALGTTAFTIGSLAVSGAQVGFMAGSLAGGLLFAPTQKSSGPRLTDLKAPQVSYGTVIPYVEGHPRLAGVIVWASEKREIATTTDQGGKGGGGSEVTTYTYEQDILYMLSENECGALLKVFKAGDLVWTAGTDAGSISMDASAQQELCDELVFYSGDSAQLADPTYEAAVGVGNAPAYRGRCTVMLRGVKLGSSGQLPAFTFVVVQGAAGTSNAALFDAPLATDVHDIETPAASDAITNPGGLAFTGGWARFAGASNASVQYTAAKLVGDSPVKDYRLAIQNVASSGSSSYQYIWELVESSYNVKFGFIRTSTTTTLYQPPQDGVRDYGIHGQSFASGLAATVAGANAEIDFRTTVQGLPFGPPYDYDYNAGTGFGSYKFNNGSGIISTNTMAIGTSSSTATALHLAAAIDGVDTTLDEYASQSAIRITLGDGADGAVSIYADGALIHSGTTAAVTGFGTINLKGYGAGGAAGVSTWDGQHLTVYVGLEGSVSAVEPTLQEVVERQCTRAGLDLAFVDASALADYRVRAMALSQLSSPRSVIEMLSQAFQFRAVESEVIRFNLRGGSSIASIAYDDLVVTGDGEPLPITKANDLELPVQVFVRYSNVFDDYQDGNESSDRLISSGQNTSQVEFPLGMTPEGAKHIADVQVMDAAASALRFGPFSLTRDYAKLEPTDVVTLHDAAGNSFRARLTRKSEAGGVLTFEAVSDDATVISSSATTSTTGYTNSTTVAPPIDTDLELLDIPILADADDDAGLYAAVKGASGSTYPGAVLFKSADDVTFESVARLDSASVIGTATTTLGSGAVGVLDEANTVTVDVGAGELSSVTRTVLLNGNSNAMLIGSEVIQFRDATLVSAGVYTLSGLLRGLRGTDWAVGSHIADERVVLLGTALRRASMSTSELGVSKHWKAVTIGRSTASATSEPFTNTGIGKKPFAPVDVRIGRDTSNNITVTLQRRTRLATRLIGALGVSCPLGEASESYEVDVFTDGTRGTRVRTIAATSASFAYSAALQTSDFGSAQSTIYITAYQLSAAVGRGYGANAQG